MNIQSEELAGIVQKAIAAMRSAPDSVAFREADSAAALRIADIFAPRVAFRGRRKNDEPLLDRFMKDVVFGASDCWYWRKVRPQGYGESYLMGERFAHRVSYRIHHGEIPEGMFVLHKCDVRNCVNPEHLFLGTYADNHRDMVEKGRNPKGYKKPNHWMRGSLSPNAKLTESQAQEIKAAYKDGESGADLARKYGVSRGLIYNIGKGRVWKHLGDES